MNRPPKKTLRRIEVPGTARFLTFSCYRRHRFFDNPRLRDRFAEHLAAISLRWEVRVLACVIMPEHLHLIVHRNPLAHGMVRSSIDWRWSSACGYEGRIDAIGPAISFETVPESMGR